MITQEMHTFIVLVAFTMFTTFLMTLLTFGT